MNSRFPDYYQKFHCLAGACPHTCCSLWEVPVDAETARFCRAFTGTLGEPLRAALTTDEDGELCFRLSGERCPFLDADGLCSIQRELGEARLPATCREHPRFSYDYGEFRERGLCASCPEAARLVLSEDFVLIPKRVKIRSGVLKGFDLLRECSLAIFQPEARNGGPPFCAPNRNIRGRLRALLLFSGQAQACLDTVRDSAGRAARSASILRQAARRFRKSRRPARFVRVPGRNDSLRVCLNFLLRLEILTGPWRELLERALASPESLSFEIPEEQGRRAACYFLYRHWFRGLNDWDVASWAKFAVLGVVVSASLVPLEPGGFHETFRLFCQEIEHSQENLDSLQEFFRERFPLPETLALTSERP